MLTGYFCQFDRPSRRILLPSLKRLTHCSTRDYLFEQHVDTPRRKSLFSIAPFAAPVLPLHRRTTASALTKQVSQRRHVLRTLRLLCSQLRSPRGTTDAPRKPPRDQDCKHGISTCSLNSLACNPNFNETRQSALTDQSETAFARQARQGSPCTPSRRLNLQIRPSK